MGDRRRKSLANNSSRQCIVIHLKANRYDSQLIAFRPFSREGERKGEREGEREREREREVAAKTVR